MLPELLLKSLEGIKDFNRQTFEEIHNKSEKLVSVRLNPAKYSADVFQGMTKVPWSSQGYYLQERPSFILDPLWHAGAYYVQEASSMFLEVCIRQTTDLAKPLKVLDLCAAPGGKSTLIQSLISSDSLLISNEVIKSRVNILAENMCRWGAVNAIITNNDPRDFGRLPHYFDLMVIDAPCSGSGLFRRDANAVTEWSPEAVVMCSQRQQRIITDAVGALKKDGILIYSTCSYSREENEAICDWLCAHFDFTPLTLTIPEQWNITVTESPEFGCHGYRFFPDRLRGEGFFVACFRKNDGDIEIPEGKKKSLERLSVKEAGIVSSWLKDPASSRLYHLHEGVFAFPSSLDQDLAVAVSSLYVKKAGVRCGKLMHGELVPEHDLALSGLLSDEIVALPLKKDEAVQYLRKEEVNIDTTYRGWALVQYLDQGLGWVKLLKNRANNYYPKEWRILKSGNN